MSSAETDYEKMMEGMAVAHELAVEHERNKSSNHVAALREAADTRVFKPETFRRARETMRQAAIYIEGLEHEKAVLTKIGAGALGDLARAVYPPDETNAEHKEAWISYWRMKHDLHCPRGVDCPPLEPHPVTTAEKASEQRSYCVECGADRIDKVPAAKTSPATSPCAMQNCGDERTDESIYCRYHAENSPSPREGSRHG